MLVVLLELFVNGAHVAIEFFEHFSLEESADDPHKMKQIVYRDCVLLYSVDYEKGTHSPYTVSVRAIKTHSMALLLVLIASLLLISLCFMATYTLLTVDLMIIDSYNYTLQNGIHQYCVL